VRANDSVEVVGVEDAGITRGGRADSFLSADVGEGARGTGGSLTIETRRLSIRDGARVSVRTFGEGNAGAN
jgi:large exoprotein involved in heme utilization and adhesion